MILKIGSKGPAVAELHRKLKAIGFYDGDLDESFDRDTYHAVLGFQLRYESLVDDGEVGPLTSAKIDQALGGARIGDGYVVPAEAPIKCDPVTWSAWLDFVRVLEQCRYGPGRGLFVGDEFVATYGPGALGSKSWKSARGVPFHSFHCTSLVNFALSWLRRRNQDYTHAGNIPSVFDLLSKSDELHVEPQDGWVLRYRGFGGFAEEISTNGSARPRIGRAVYLDAREILERRAELPTFMVFAQSSKISATKVKWWHHVGMYVVDHHDGDRLYRIAADGFYNDRGWSGTPIRWREVTPSNVDAHDGVFYRLFGVRDRADGTFGDLSRPMARAVLER